MPGIRNTYRDNMPVSEAILKDILHAFTSLKNFVLNGFKKKSIFVYPDYPSKKTSLYKIAKHLNMDISNKGRNAESLYVYWEDQTFATEAHAEIKGLAMGPVLNAGCQDISKEKVDEVFKQSFGYSTIVDPLTEQGQAVAKSDINALHDGEIIKLPIDKPEQDKVYQILIDNSSSEDEVLDYRIPIVGEALDFVFLKYKDRKVRFDNVTTRVEVKPALDIFSQDELNQINSFCKTFQLDFGELDILRDNHSKKIYIIDVNKTPYSPPADLNKDDQKACVEKLSNSFLSKFQSTNK